MKELDELFQKLNARKEALEAELLPIRAERDALAAEMAPLEAKSKSLADKIKALSPELAEVNNQLAGIAAARGGRSLGKG